MSDQCWTATITQLEPIPGKDRIELATIDGYQSIVEKGRYKVGDKVCYISEQSLVPALLQQELGLEGRLAGSAKDRVKAIKMGGVLSQGIVCQPHIWKLWHEAQNAGQEVATLDDVLGVSKWEPKIPIQLMGKIERPRGNAPIIAMYDIENIKKLRHFDVESETWWDPFQGHLVEVTEKIHGTNLGLHMNSDRTLYVYSKGVGQRGWTLVEDDNNVYWRAVHANPGIVDYMKHTIDSGAFGITVFGEIFGRGIQDMGYDTEFDVCIFDERVNWNDRLGQGVVWSTPLFWADHFNFKLVPNLGVMEYDWEGIEALAAQPSAINGGLREGVVVRSLTWPTNHLGVPHKAKFINPAYLTRKGGTEYN